LGGQYKFDDGRRNPDTVNAIIKYKRWNLTFESTVLQVKHPRPSVIFEGTLGTLDIGRDSYVFTPHQGTAELVKAAGDLDKALTASFLAAMAGSLACGGIHLLRVGLAAFGIGEASISAHDQKFAADRLVITSSRVQALRPKRTHA